MLRRRLRDDRGATIVEFALGSMVFFTLVLLIAQGGLMFHGWLGVTHAAREAARYGAICYGRSIDGCDEGQVRDRALSAASAIGVSAAQIDEPEVNEIDGGTWLEVRLTYHPTVIAPLVGDFVPETLSASSEMRREYK